jgi:hypothetical protein
LYSAAARNKSAGRRPVRWRHSIKPKALAGEINSRQVVLIRPDLSLLVLACPDAGSIPEALIQQVDSIVPSSVKRKIGVVTDTGFAPAGSRAEVGSPAWTSVGKDLPFFGILNGLGCIGHTVWIFDVSADLGIACRDADILIIDSAVSERVPESALDLARGVMRTHSIFVHGRQTFQLRPVAPRRQNSVSWEARSTRRAHARGHSAPGDDAGPTRAGASGHSGGRSP